MNAIKNLFKSDLLLIIIASILILSLFVFIGIFDALLPSPNINITKKIEKKEPIKKIILTSIKKKIPTKKHGYSNLKKNNISNPLLSPDIINQLKKKDKINKPNNDIMDDFFSELDTPKVDIHNIDSHKITKENNDSKKISNETNDMFSSKKVKEVKLIKKEIIIQKVKEIKSKSFIDSIFNRDTPKEIEAKVEQPNFSLQGDKYECTLKSYSFNGANITNLITYHDNKYIANGKFIALSTIYISNTIEAKLSYTNAKKSIYTLYQIDTNYYVLKYVIDEFYDCEGGF